MRLNALAALSAVFLGGCGNSVYFYETEKFTLATLEARPDPSQPVQLNVGFKQRVVVVSPPVEPKGDASSVLGKFYLDRRPKSDAEDGGVTIRTSLFAGEAATGLSPAQKANVLKGLAKSEWRDRASSSIGYATKNQKLKELGEIAASDFDRVDFEKVKEATGLEKENYTLELHNAIRAQLSAHN